MVGVEHETSSRPDSWSERARLPAAHLVKRSVRLQPRALRLRVCLIGVIARALIRQSCHVDNLGVTAW